MTFRYDTFYSVFPIMFSVTVFYLEKKIYKSTNLSELCIKTKTKPRNEQSDRVTSTYPQRFLKAGFWGFSTGSTALLRVIPRQLKGVILFPVNMQLTLW